VRTTLVALLLVGAIASAAPRSAAMRAEFQRLNPCPANGATRGTCPNFAVDHIEPLCAGGDDSLVNLQWLSVEAHKDKTRRDVAACRGRVYRPPASAPA
jgi:hypothetical protein